MEYRPADETSGWEAGASDVAPLIITCEPARLTCDVFRTTGCRSAQTSNSRRRSRLIRASTHRPDSRHRCNQPSL